MKKSRTLRVIFFHKRLILLFCFSLFFLASQAQPRITSFSPTSGPIGTTVTINGINFSSTPANNIVFFGAVRATIASATTTALTVIVPAGATFEPISLTVNGLTGNSLKPFVVTFNGGGPITQNPNQTQNCFDQGIDSLTDLKPNDIAIKDFDGDGRPDLVTANNYSTAGQPASISILRNIGSGQQISFNTKQDIPTGSLTTSIASGDIDGDGKPDIVSGSITDKSLSVFKNTSTPGILSFGSKIDFAVNNTPFSISISDIDSDGKLDIVIANSSVSSINYLTILRNTTSGGTISFAPKIDIVTPYVIRSVATGDINGDTKPDVILANTTFNSVSVFRNISAPGNILFASKVDFVTGNYAMDVALADLDGDEKDDIIAANNVSNTFSVFRNVSFGNTISFTSKIDFSCGGSPFSVSAGDVNGDGKPEIIVPSYNMSVHQNNCTIGNISFGGPVYLFLPNTANTVGVADLNNDGKADVTGTNFSSSSVTILRNKNNEPSVLSFTPTTASAGNTVTVTGVNFSGATALSFGGVPAMSFTIVNPTTITATVGNGASGSISVTNQYGTGEKTGFVFAGPPMITSFSPTVATIGAVVTIYGQNFTGVTSVSFGGTAASSYTVITPNRIDAVVGAGSTGNLTVTTTYGSGTLGNFTFIPKPAITSFSPVEGGLGSVITINGSNLQNVTEVKFGSVMASSFTILSPNLISAVVGTGATGTVSVSVPGNVSVSLSGFSYIGPPVITSFTPITGAIGETVTITGNFLGSATAVTIGGIPVTSFSVLSSTSLRVLVGNGASGNVSVTTPFGTATQAGFIFKELPKINSFSPQSGPPGTTVIISGSNFSDNIAGNTVFLGAIKALIVSATSTSLTVVVPAGVTNEPILVITNGLTAYSERRFNVNFPGGGNNYLFNTNSFSPKIHFNAGFDAFDLSTGDLDGDGKPDIVVPGISFNIISVLRNTSAPATGISFDAKVDFTFDAGPRGIRIADVNADGKPDIIVANAGGKTVSVFRNNSTIGVVSFQMRTDFQSDALYPMAVAVDDFDADGKPDIALANTSGSLINTNSSISLFRNTGISNDISFSRVLPYTIPHEVFDISSGDIDNDGKKDIVTAHRLPALVCIMRNTSTPGNISFAPRIDLSCSHGTKSVVLADLDFDNKPEIITLSYDKVSVFRNLSTPNNFLFAERIDLQANPSSPGKLSIADMDGDDKVDIIAANGNSSGKVSIYKNKSQPGSIFLEPKADYDAAYYINNFNYDPVSIAVSDVDLDGKGDIIAGNSSSSTITILKNNVVGINIASFNPVSGSDGTAITITGSGFNGATSVTFGNVAASSFTVVNANTIIATVANGASGQVRVTGPSGSSSKSGFTYNPVTSLNNQVAGVNFQLTILPNPADKLINVTHPSSKKAYLAIVDVAGRNVKYLQPVIDTRQTLIDIKELPSGMYNIVWSDGKRRLSRTFMKN